MKPRHCTDCGAPVRTAADYHRCGRCQADFYSWLRGPCEAPHSELEARILLYGERAGLGLPLFESAGGGREG